MQMPAFALYWTEPHLLSLYRSIQPVSGDTESPNRHSVSPVKVRGWKVLESAQTSGYPGEANRKIYMKYEGTDSSWTFIPIRQAWCTVEEITFDSGGIKLLVNPTYESSHIGVTLLALKLSR